MCSDVANRDEILAGIVDAVVSEIEPPSDARRLKTAIRRSAISAEIPGGLEGLAQWERLGGAPAESRGVSSAEGCDPGLLLIP